MNNSIPSENTVNPHAPTSAFVAVTMLCNSRCVMCDIWKNRGKDFLPVSVYGKLPPGLRMIDITGGEPFLRPDIPDIVGVLRSTCPRARILITTNGFLTEKIARDLPAILRADPAIAFRISLDGWGIMHERIRGIPNAFQKAMATVHMLKDAGVRDVGIVYTLMKDNKKDLLTVFEYARKHGLNFSMNVVHDSPVYFGKEKVSLRPDPASVKDDIVSLVRKQMKSLHPKDMAKAWVNLQSYHFMTSHVRPFPCGAGERFFYMDPAANIYPCHLKNWPVGNLRTQRFEDIWNSPANSARRKQAHVCNDCWIVCTAKDGIREHPLRVASDLLRVGLTGADA